MTAFDPKRTLACSLTRRDPSQTGGQPAFPGYGTHSVLARSSTVGVSMLKDVHLSAEEFSSLSTMGAGLILGAPQVPSLRLCEQISK